ncbi:MAG: hypothetical protein IKM55_02905 [Bacilli bacterium]|nr:hypothetical protein [Bacillota bacterium]MBR6821150.1 hypothetical protein [Bacilli bacterium]
MKKIYIVLTYTGTILSKIVKVYTRREFSHVSIALDEDLKEMYSFGRINAYNPFWAGFVHEDVNKGTFKRFKKTKARVYSLTVKDEQYEKVKEVIRDIQNNKLDYNFNILGLLGVVINYKVKRERYFYCAEFVKYVLEQSNICYLPDIVKPEDFKEIDNLNVVYNGQLREYGN